MKKMCKGYDKMVILEGFNRTEYTYSADRVIKFKISYDYGAWFLLCGDVRIKYQKSCFSNRCQFVKEINNEFDGFMAVMVEHNKLKNLTVDFWLNLTKGF